MLKHRNTINRSLIDEKWHKDRNERIMITMLCPYAVGQIITQDNGTQEIVCHISKVDDEFIVQTRVLAGLSGYYKVQADGSLKNGLSR
jgi:hypothetical protein